MDDPVGPDFKPDGMRMHWRKLALTVILLFGPWCLLLARSMFRF